MAAEARTGLVQGAVLVFGDHPESPGFHARDVAPEGPGVEVA